MAARHGGEGYVRGTCWVPCEWAIYSRLSVLGYASGGGWPCSWSRVVGVAGLA
ncbi:Protein of unknown function [Pyronema omphalodes CBS 100304]|uniref:Uncharacterized protein n=1 Tax=Pyronema omphalodes (strain CBS 100304) TaxID=1076935 RepID=U4L859_PYROM|nr:Protein of unknown function [Pyronema omphalodes CBS 100304]